MFTSIDSLREHRQGDLEEAKVDRDVQRDGCSQQSDQ